MRFCKVKEPSFGEKWGGHGMGGRVNLRIATLETNTKAWLGRLRGALI